MVAISCRHGLEARFAADDMMNLARYVGEGWSSILKGTLAFWEGSYRPLGGLFYLSLYTFFRLDPLPYRIVIHGILAVNLLLSLRAAELLTRSRLTAAVTTLFVGYHPALFNLHYETSVIYDVLCYSFYLAAVILYVSKRRDGAALGSGAAALLLLFYICALNAKEMAITLPLTLAAYELFVRPGWKQSTGLRRRALPLVALAVAGVGYGIGKMAGPNALGQVAAYAPKIRWDLWIEFTRQELTELLHVHRIDHPAWIAFGVVLSAMLFLEKRGVFRWAVVFLFVSSLPLAFIRPMRGGASLYLPLFGMALAAATILQRAGKWLSGTERWLWKARATCMARTLFVCGTGLAYAAYVYGEREPAGIAWRRTQDLTWTMIQQMESLRRRHGMVAGERILFLDDPFDGWDMYFITQLVLGDRAPRIVLQKKESTLVSVSEMDHVFRLENGRIVRMP